MDKPYKLHTKPPMPNVIERDKQISDIGDQFRQLSHPKEIKTNGVEKFVFNAMEEQEKFQSFHEVLGPVLTGLLYQIPFHVEN